MTPAELRAVCDGLNNEHGTGGQSRLARMLGWSVSTIQRKLKGQTPISQSDELAIERAIEKHVEEHGPEN